MVLARAFTQAKDNDYESLVSAHGRLRAILDALSDGTLPPDYDDEALAAYTASLISLQGKDGSFSVSREPGELSADERDDALRFVSWVAASLLCRLRSDMPDTANSVEGLDEALARVLNWAEAADFAFPESGPAEAVQQVEAAFILASGRIPAFLKESPEIAPKMADGIRTLEAGFRKRLESGDTSLPGGIDYRSLFEEALAGLTV